MAKRKRSKFMLNAGYRGDPQSVHIPTARNVRRQTPVFFLFFFFCFFCQGCFFWAPSLVCGRTMKITSGSPKHKQLMEAGGVSKLHLAVFQGKQDKVRAGCVPFASRGPSRLPLFPNNFLGLGGLHVSRQAAVWSRAQRSLISVALAPAVDGAACWCLVVPRKGCCIWPAWAATYVRGLERGV